MKIAIVHISDIHFKTTSDVGFKRLEKLSNRIAFSRSNDEELLFLITGDIANTGSAFEYGVASTFFRQLLISLNLEVGTPKSPIVLIPGNHDCDFHDLGDLRQILLDQIHDQLESIDVGGETVKAILRVQENFFQFNAQITGIDVPMHDRILYGRKIEFGNKKLELRCFNSAWLSNRHESVGTLGFPKSIARAAAQKTDSDVVISLIHHPFNWISPVSYQSFRKAIQESSNFLLTGHEHSRGGQIIEPLDGGRLLHLESGPFQPDMSGDSQFSIIHLDLGARTWRVEACTWQKGSYGKIFDGEPQALGDCRFNSSALSVTTDFLDRVSDPGTGFLHPRKHDLSLSDIYVYPDLKTRLSNRLRIPEDLPKEISGPDALEKILLTERLVITGPTDCGKTALSKMLFLDGNAKVGHSPILLSGASFKGKEPLATYKKAIANATNEIYGLGQEGSYADLERKHRILIIDDWDEVGFNRAGRQAILREATSHFGCVILFADDIFLIEEISGRHEHKPLEDFQIADIREFGFRLRGQLIRKWHALGNTFIEDEKAFARKVAESTRVIDTVLGRNLLPSYPVNVLTLLQTYDAGAGSSSGGLGSFGQVYEALITARLARVSIKSIDIGTKVTLLSRVAWYLFSHEQQNVSDSEWRNIIARYFEEYAIVLDSGLLLASLIEAGILREDTSGYRFTYGYTLCYFVAKYFQENLADLDHKSGRPELYERLKRLSERVYKQDNANIVIFYVFLTKDRELINHLIANARMIFAEFDEFDFDKHVRFVNRIIEPVPPALLPESSTDSNQQDYDRKRDESGEQIEPRGDPTVENVIYGPELPYEQKLVIGIRYLGLMGQVLRNFPGSLKKEVKLELATESYSLGLRILGIIFKLSERDSDLITKDISAILRKKMAFSGIDSELKVRAELVMAELLREITFGILKRLSHAIGLSELEETYEEVARLRENNLPCQMIQLSIRLDHFSKFPKEPISKLVKEVKKNVFGYQTLRDLVLNHLYLFPASYEDQQWAGKLLGFKANTVPILGSSQKLLKK